MVTLVTVDGPSGSGKGTVCRILADKLGFSLLDSGAIYRIAALSALKQNIALDDTDALVNMAADLDIRFNIVQEGTQVLLDGVDVSRDIREEKTGMIASKIAPIAKLRQALLERQRAFSLEPGLVADGRDMGTVVFPEAKFKFFLTASAEERAKRRVLQLGGVLDDTLMFDKILTDIQERDDRDMNRGASPLKPADDAIYIDSSELSIEQVVTTLEEHIQTGLR